MFLLNVLQEDISIASCFNALCAFNVQQVHIPQDGQDAWLVQQGHIQGLGMEVVQRVQQEPTPGQDMEAVQHVQQEPTPGQDMEAVQHVQQEPTRVQDMEGV